MNYRDYFKKEAVMAKLKNAPDKEYDEAELKKGIAHEAEHTNDKAAAEVIAKQHLAEDPHYYSKMSKAGLDECGFEDVESGLPKLGGALAVPHVGQPIHMSKIIQVGPLGGSSSATGELSGMTACDKKGVATDKGGVKVGTDSEPITAGGKSVNPDLARKTVGGEVTVNRGEKQGGPNSQGTYANTAKMTEGGDNSCTPRKGQDITVDLQEQKRIIRKKVMEVLKEITFNKKTGKWQRINEDRYARFNPDDFSAQSPGKGSPQPSLNQYGKLPRIWQQTLGGEDKWVVMGKDAQAKTFDAAKHHEAEQYFKSLGGDIDRAGDYGETSGEQDECRNYGASHNGFEPNVYNEELNMKMGPSYKAPAGRQYRTSDDDLARAREYEPEITEQYDEEEESQLQEAYFDLLTKKTLLKESEMSKMKKIKDRLDYIRENKEKWIQKAIKPSHKGYCTPMTKSTCTPKRKALAKRFKSGDLSECDRDATMKMGASYRVAGDGRQARVCDDDQAHRTQDTPTMRNESAEDVDPDLDAYAASVKSGKGIQQAGEKFLKTLHGSQHASVDDIDPEPEADVDEAHQDLGYDYAPGEKMNGGSPINLDVSKIEDVEVDGVDSSDYPDFVDAYVSSATIDGRELTDEELDWLNNEHPEIAQQAAHGHLQGAGDYAMDASKDESVDETVNMRMGPSYKVVAKTQSRNVNNDQARANQYDPQMHNEAGGAAENHTSYRTANDARQLPKNRHRGDIDETVKKSEVQKTIEKGGKGKTTAKKQKLAYKAPKKTKSGITKKRD